MAELSESEFLKVLLGWALILAVIVFSYLYLGIVPSRSGIGYRPCQPIVVYDDENVCISEAIVGRAECEAGFSLLPERRGLNAEVEGLAFHLRLARRPAPSAVVVQDRFARLDDGSLIHLRENCNFKPMVEKGRAVKQLRAHLRDHKYLYAHRGQR
ncbi:hypothetical protein [Methylorubrum sp. SL192]|uniref:hypothetical protein n=1 Tax=Methylorubrum sp. SL192 TaxID=2995167 RepID=UPI0022742BA3|nr:hypothetical protein [Methylorubrum sp. SL192]MCY1643918.1 hypothetical protein [Methylorubrum sp. SL192]